MRGNRRASLVQMEFLCHTRVFERAAVAVASQSTCRGCAEMDMNGHQCAVTRKVLATCRRADRWADGSGSNHDRPGVVVALRHLTSHGSLPRIGFIGLGGMGTRMASRLVNAGYGVTVYDRTRRRAEGVPVGNRVWPNRRVGWPFERSGGAPLVPVMEAADLWNRHDAAVTGRRRNHA